MENLARVLIVEDEPILALELKEDLQGLGYQVSEIVGDGDMVLHSFLRHRPDVILIDIKLQGFRDGVDSAHQIRGFYKTPIIYISSYAESEVRDRLSKTQPYHYVQKPYHLPQLSQMIQKVLV